MSAPSPSDSDKIRSGTLTVVRAVGTEGFETFIQDHRRRLGHRVQWSCRSRHRHRTSLAQIVADELDVSFARVVVVLGDTSLRAQSGRDDCERTIQITAVPLRKAAAHRGSS